MKRIRCRFRFRLDLALPGFFLSTLVPFYLRKLSQNSSRTFLASRAHVRYPYWGTGSRESNLELQRNGRSEFDCTASQNHNFRFFPSVSTLRNKRRRKGLESSWLAERSRLRIKKFSAFNASQSAAELLVLLPSFSLSPAYRDILRVVFRTCSLRLIYLLIS